ncbi:MAG: polysaccharide biosynthesis/export family protein [Planctomycetia bacterium]|nr:polysaccharide biosynthesis/export family protein [Planctomycetia bacterium]
MRTTLQFSAGRARGVLRLILVVGGLVVSGLVVAAQAGAQQPLSPASPRPIWGVDCTANGGGGCGECRWRAMAPIPWESYAQGEYVGPARTAHVPEYRLRVDDQLEAIYRVTREPTAKPYELQVGDVIGMQSFADENLNRELIVLPDGTVTLRLLGQVRADGQTVEQLRNHLEDLYKKYYKVPAITVTPLKVNTRLEDLRATIDSRYGSGGQGRQAIIAPDGTIALPALPRVPAQGLTLSELKREIDERYSRHFPGMEVTPQLVQRAPRYVYVVGEVNNPGRFTLVNPTTAMQAIAMAGSWRIGANLNQVVVFRRGEDWQLMATMLDLRGALYGKRPCPSDEIWLSDSDIIVVPKSPILVADDMIDLVFTRGLYGVFPANFTFNKLTSF